MNRLALLLALAACGACVAEQAPSAAGRAQLAAGQWEQAAATYEQAGAQQPAPPYELGLAIAAANTRDEERAAAARERLAANAQPALLALAWYDAGNAALRRGEAAAAIAAYERSLLLVPGAAATSHNLQLALLLQQAGGGAGDADAQRPPQASGAAHQPAGQPGASGPPRSQPEGQGTQASARPQDGPAGGRGQGPASAPGDRREVQRRLEEVRGRQQVNLLEPDATQRPLDAVDSMPPW